MTPQKPLVVHVISSLGNGGAEATLFRLCALETRYNHHVVSLTDSGVYGRMLHDVGIGVTTIGLTSNKFSIWRILLLWRCFRQLRPDVVQTWMYHADLLGGILARLAGVRRVFWNIRHTNINQNSLKQTTIIVAYLCALLSRRVPYRIICCANAAKLSHINFGYCAQRMTVIQNGYDEAESRVAVSDVKGFLQSMALDSDVPLLGMVARFDCNKDHRGLLRALATLKNDGYGFHALLIGPGMNSESQEVVSLLNDFDVASHVTAIGPRMDISTVYTALDIHVLVSLSEGFPNVIAEAMLCGTPCVVTDVGDAAEIVGQLGWVVPSANHFALVAALKRALVCYRDRIRWLKLKRSARERIRRHYSIETMVDRYIVAWSSDRKGM